MPTQAALSSYLKAGFQGGTGTGKTTTAALALLGLSVTLHDKAPVYVFDTEPGWHFLKPLFEQEGVHLEIVNGRSFKAMHAAIRRAVKDGACGFGVDSLTHPWAELLASFADGRGKVPFHRFNQLKPLWNEWTLDFLDSPLHAIVCGRLTWEYDYEKDEDGKKELVKGDSKMKAGGGESFGYEPHITFEMSSEQIREAGRLKGMQYVATVLKDRTRQLNGKEFVFTDIGGSYKTGGYVQVFKMLKPHLDYLARITGVTLGRDNSRDLVKTGDSEWSKTQQSKKVALETIETTMGTVLWPGADKETKKLKVSVLESLFGTRSWSAVENLPLDVLQHAVAVLQQYEKEVKAGKVVSTEAEALGLIADVSVMVDADKSVGNLGITEEDLKAMTGENAIF